MPRQISCYLAVYGPHFSHLYFFAPIQMLLLTNIKFNEMKQIDRMEAKLTEVEWNVLMERRQNTID